MATVDLHPSESVPVPRAAPSAETPAWGNSAPLALAAFAVTTFMLSLINAHVVPVGTTPVVFAVAFMFGGVAQLIAGIICLRNGNVFAGALFGGFGAFWLSFYAIGEFFLKSVPPLQAGHALGLFLYAFAIYATILFIASFRTSIATVLALALLAATLFVLGAGNYTATSGLIKTGGWMGIILAGIAFYLALAELCQVEYGREYLPVGHLAKVPDESLGE